MRLRRSEFDLPGLRRIRRGRGFSYVDDAGARVSDKDHERILALVIPPAWRDVWICPYANGHIQVVGTDDAGRRQYLYHPAWRVQQDEEKHLRVLRLARHLPVVREAVGHRLRRRGHGRARVVAVALRMLDAGLFRTGGEEYEQMHGSYGVATLLHEHVTVRGDVLTFCFPAKSGIEREAQVTDPDLARAVRSLRRAGMRGDRLLRYRIGDEWHDLLASDIRSEFKDLAGEEFTVKDLRTWAATVVAAVSLARLLAEAGPDSGEDHAGREKAAFAEVAAQLGNTPAVAESSYVNPRVIEQHTEGRTVLRSLRRSLTKADRRRLARGDLAMVRDRDALDKVVLRFLERAYDT
ncbi:MAG: DNA topoisomerase IB [Intrasporangium sp.]|uniref:DNA topoisomerase IB n=1 Tax=Intrasporangium sp. TaxID=1925024 RepID=UPI00264851D4|nr:DNA topoisomerase IB [Intrasporangium sp.]MDN5798226.1 DNA topoisomerase IB [Intrasporangium sp.]